MTTLIGIPDPKVIAEELEADGYWSCDAAEAHGWLVTSHGPTRYQVDRILAATLFKRMTGRNLADGI